jgi:putative transposase
MPQSLHVLSVHIIFSTKERRPWLTRNIRERVWAYQSRILQNLECNSITIGGTADHVHVLCNLTKKFPTAKVLEMLKKDSSKFVKTLHPGLRDFHWQDGYGLFGVSASHFEPVRKYILDQEKHHKKETFQEEYLRILRNIVRLTTSGICGTEKFWAALSGRLKWLGIPSTEGVALGYDGSRLSGGQTRFNFTEFGIF